MKKGFLHPDYLAKRAPILFARPGQLYQPGLGDSIAIRPNVDTGEVSLEVIGTPFCRRYDPDLFGNRGLGTLMEISHRIAFVGDLTMIRPIDIMEHCALQLEGNYANRLVFFLN